MQDDVKDYPWFENPFERVRKGEMPIHHGLVGAALVIAGIVIAAKMPEIQQKIREYQYLLQQRQQQQPYGRQ